MPSTTETPTGSVPAMPSGRRAPHANLVVLTLALAGLSFSILQSMIAPALATISEDLGVSTADVAWALTAYLLSASVMTPILGRLGDMVGKRRILIVVVVILLIGTLVAALAPNLAVLIVGRALQGASGAVMPLSIGIVRDELPRERIGVTIGLLSAISGIGAGIGIVAAGPIVENLSWQWLFWLPLVLIVLALLGIVFGMPESPVRNPGRLDVPGAILLSAALVALLLAISEGQNWGWGSFSTLALLVGGALALLAFILVELRVEQPLVDMRLVRLRGVWTANLLALTFGFAMFGTFVLVPTLLQLPASTGYGFGVSASQAGLLLLPTVAMMVVFGPVAGALVRRFGPKPPMVISALALITAFALPAIGHDQLWQIIVSGLLTGAAIGLAFSAAANAIIESVPIGQTGESIGVNTIARTVGSSAGTAVIAALISSGSNAQGLPADNAFTLGFIVCAGVGVLALVAAISAPSLRRRKEQAQALGVEDL